VLERLGLEHLRALARDRRQPQGGVRHHVADHFRPAGDALGRERLGGALVRAEQECREPVDFDPVSLLGHRQVPAPQSCFHVGLPHAGVVGGQRPCERRVRVAVDEHDVGLALGDCSADARPHRGRLRRVKIE